MLKFKIKKYWAILTVNIIEHETGFLMGFLMYVKRMGWGKITPPGLFLIELSYQAYFWYITSLSYVFSNACRKKKFCHHFGWSCHHIWSHFSFFSKKRQNFKFPYLLKSKSLNYLWPLFGKPKCSRFRILITQVFKSMSKSRILLQIWHFWIWRLFNSENLQFLCL